VSTLVGAIGSDLLRFGKWVVATDTPTATDLLDFTWFETSFSFLATSFSGTFVGAQDIQFSVPNIPGATFEMTLTPGSLFTNPTFLYKTGSASQAAGTFPNFDFNTTIISGRIVFQSKLIPASRFIRHDMEAVLGVTSPDAFNLQTASVVGSVITYTAHTYQVKQDGDIFFSKLVTERDWTSSPFTWSLISKKYSTISFDGVTGAVIETPRVVNEKTIMVSGLLDTNAAGSPWSGNVSAYELNRFSGFAGGFNRKSLVTAMTHSDFAVPGTRVFTGGVTTIDDTAASHYRRDAAATGPSSDSLRTSILQWDGVTFEVIANDTVPAITIFKEGVDLLVDNSIDINEAINTSQHNTDLRHLNAYAVGNVTETPDPPGAQFSGSWTVTYLDDELGVTLNEALAGSPAKLSIPSENSTTVFPQYTPWLDTDPNFGTNPPSILASDPVGDNDADRITAPSQFRYGDFAPLRAQSLTIFWPKLSTTRDGLCAVHRTANWVAARDAWRAEVLNPGATPSSIAIARAAMLAEHIVVYNNFVPEDLIISLEDGDYIVIDNQTIL
jgi:hypothetical protein